MEFIGSPHAFLGNVLPCDFRPTIFRLIEAAWLRVENPQKIWLEPRITGCLAKALIDEQEFRFAGDPPFHIQEDVKIRDNTTGKENARTDLEIHLRQPYIRGQKPYFIFEAKRLNIPYDDKLDTNASEYVGAEGMRCLLTDKYSVTPGHGGMLGYVMDGCVQSARDAIEKLLLLHKSETLLVEPPVLRPISCLPPNIAHIETHHSMHKETFTVFHILLRV